MTVRVGETLNVMCKAGLRTTVEWRINGAPVAPDQWRTYVHEAIDVTENVKTSLLVIEDLTLADGGTYTCRNAASSSDVDSINVNVLSEGVSSSSIGCCVVAVDWLLLDVLAQLG